MINQMKDYKVIDIVQKSILMNLMSVYHWQFFYRNCLFIIRIIINGHVMDIIIKRYKELMEFMNI